MKEFIVPLNSSVFDLVHRKELIRCGDCKHFDGQFCHHPRWGDGHANYMPPIKEESGFCDWAERREK